MAKLILWQNLCGKTCVAKPLWQNLCGKTVAKLNTKVKGNNFATVSPQRFCHSFATKVLPQFCHSFATGLSQTATVLPQTVRGGKSGKKTKTQNKAIDQKHAKITNAIKEERISKGLSNHARNQKNCNSIVSDKDPSWLKITNVSRWAGGSLQILHTTVARKRS